MEDLAEILRPYKSYIALIAKIVSIAQLMSPAVVLNGMRKTKSTNGIPSKSFMIILIFTVLGVRFSLLIKDDASFSSNLIGVTFSIIYLSTYFYFVSPNDRPAELKKLSYTIAFISVIMLYSKLEDPAKIEHRFGLLFTVLLFSVMVLPILDSIKAYKLKSTRHLPFPMILTGFLVGLSWFLHGIIINSEFVIFQNAIMLIINIIQLSFFLIYPSDPPVSKDQQKKKN